LKTLFQKKTKIYHEAHEVDEVVVFLFSKIFNVFMNFMVQLVFV